jgi:hypothetical protein
MLLKDSPVCRWGKTLTVQCGSFGDFFLSASARTKGAAKLCLISFVLVRLLTAQELSKEIWEVHDKTDPLSGRLSFEASMGVLAQSNGKLDAFTITSTCDLDSWHFSLSGPSPYKLVENNLRLSGAIGVIVGTLGGYGPRVVVRAKIDDNEVQYYSLNPDSDIQVRFSISYLNASVVHLIKLELPLSNGDTPIVSIGFDNIISSRFGARCNRYGITQTIERPSRVGRLNTIDKAFYTGGSGLVLKALPDQTSSDSTTLPLNFPVVINGKSKDGWQHVVAGKGIDTHEGWALPGTFPDSINDTHPVQRQPMQSQSRLRPNDATGHSLDDTYARTLEIMNDNARKGIRDAIGSTGWLTPFEVCYSVKQEVIDATHIRRICDKTGEVVRVPGDLAVKPAFWDTYAQSCKAIRMGELEVKLSSPSPNDGRKRLLSCTSLFLLGARRKALTEEGLR